MSVVYVSKLAGAPLIEYLKAQGCRLHFMTGQGSPVYHAVSTHADIHMCQLGVWENTEIFMGNAGNLHTDYPGNIIYNAVCTAKYFIHNLKYTDETLLQKAQEWQSRQASHIPPQRVHTAQGYTRCCCLPVDDSSFITSDEGIAKALADYNADVLLIEKGHILLPGFDYGFIGGCAGALRAKGTSCNTALSSPAVRTILFNGDLSAHPDYQKIKAFITARSIQIIYFKEYPLTDIGSILTCGEEQETKI